MDNPNDIIDFSEALEKLRLHETIFNAVDEPMCLVDPEYRFVMINENVEKFFNLNKTEIIGKTVPEIIGNETFDAAAKARFDRCLAGEVVKFQRHFPSPESGERFIAFNYYPYRDEKGAIRGVLCIAYDLTEMKTLENAFHKAQKMESIALLSSGIAHDFNNILCPISGFTEMLMDLMPDESPHQDYLNDIFQAANRAKDLIDQILTFSRQEDQPMAPMSVLPIVKEVLKLIRSTLPPTIDLIYDISPHSPDVMANPTQIHQIVMNLATNAFHAMEEQGGLLSITVSHRTIEKNHAFPDIPSGDYLFLEVTDTGVGMHPSLIEKVFTPLFTTKPQGKGTGLGLSVVQGIVTLCQGHIDIDSEPGKGTKVTVYLPATETKQNDTTSPTNECILMGNNESILLVDDDPAVLRIEKQLLECLGYEITACSDSLQALTAFENDPYRFDLVMTDQIMPKLTGDTLARRLIDIRPEIPVVICSGMKETLERETLQQMGIKAILYKPINRKALADTLRSALGTVQRPSKML